MVRDIQIVNSPQCHLKFDSSSGIHVDNITISSPESSPNTDGIHLQNTQDVEIQHSNIGCGKKQAMPALFIGSNFFNMQCSYRVLKESQNDVSPNGTSIVQGTL